MQGRRRLLAVAGVALLPLVACEPPDPAVERVSETEDGGTPNGRSYAPSISDSGRYVAFVSEASNVGFGGLSDNGTADVFVYDRNSDRIVDVSGFDGNGPSGWAPYCSSCGAWTSS